MSAFFDMVGDVIQAAIFAAVVIVCTPLGWIGLLLIYLLFGRG